MFKEVRLAALLEAPYAFGSTYESEVGASEESWRQRVADRPRIVAEVDGKAVGIVGASSGEFTGTAALTSLWVDPRFRGRGVGTALIEAVEEWARGQNLNQVLLWVTDANRSAEKLYEHLGFTRTGRVSEVRPGEAAVEHEMAKRI
ncbi:MAG TPA: GNAT family N-acetyltransferase [Candidatus Dormibacteraeota bacterium]|nr:GNAT family N-acetyltransferase [Candidatus Dormibacteraeota bacterium]